MPSPNRASVSGEIWDEQMPFANPLHFELGVRCQTGATLIFRSSSVPSDARLHENPARACSFRCVALSRTSSSSRKHVCTLAFRSPFFLHIITPTSFDAMQTARLASIGDQLSNWSQTPLHPLFPVGALGLIHAVRVSHATRQVAGSHKSRLGVWQGLVLNQILMFGGVVISGMLLGVPSPLLSAWPVVALYGGVHVALDVTPAGKALLHAQDIELVGTL